MFLRIWITFLGWGMGEEGKVCPSHSERTHCGLVFLLGFLLVRTEGNTVLWTWVFHQSWFLSFLVNKFPSIAQILFAVIRPFLILTLSAASSSPFLIQLSDFLCETLFFVPFSTCATVFATTSASLHILTSIPCGTPISASLVLRLRRGLPRARRKG